MSKLYVLKQNKEFRSAYYRGKAMVSPFVITYVRKNRLQTARYGITTGKKVGKAVQRNRCRRIIREAFRQLEPEVKRGYDYVFVARGATVTRSSTDLQRIIREQLKKAGFLQ